MKKFRVILIVFLLMINMFCVTLNATEPATQTSNTTQTDLTANAELVENNETLINTYGKIVETQAVKDVQNGSVKEKVQEVTVEITEGDYIGEEFTTEYVLSYDIDGKILAYELEVGDQVSVQIIEDANGTTTATVLDVVRAPYIAWMAILFLGIVILIGGKKGVKAILGLIFTILLIYFIMVKGIFNGDHAIKNSIITSILVIVGTFIIIGDGINKKILTAAIGTFGGVISAGVVALIFNNLAKLTGAGEDAIQLSINMTEINFNFRQLLFAGIIVSAMGACMDVGMSIASSLDEIKLKNPDITWQELLKSGMNIGRDVIGTMTNTLILAYVGGSLNLILLFMACNMNLFEILNKETIAEQIISAIAGSIGVVCTVPITSFVYSILNRDRIIYKKTSENKVNGKRSLKI
ncbi:MAG: YibE/F family protein [Clostridia bacterium]|nr:YibE/F family protein [Clostridia bacterium]